MRTLGYDYRKGKYQMHMPRHKSPWGGGYSQMQTVDRHVAFQDSSATSIELSLTPHPPGPNHEL